MVLFFIKIENYINNESFKPEKPFDLLDDIPNETTDFSINSIFILSRKWEFSNEQPYLSSNPFKTHEIINNFLFNAKKNNAASERIKLISLQENEMDEIPENMVAHSPKLVGKLEKFLLETSPKKCLNLGELNQEELEKLAVDLAHFSNEDNFLLYSKYWFYDFDFFHPELMSIALYISFKKPDGFF